MRDLVETVILADMKSRGVRPPKAAAVLPRPPQVREKRDAKLWEACTRFEAMLLKVWLSEIAGKTGQAWVGRSFAGSVYHALWLDAVADAARTQTPLGLAQALYRSFAEAQAGAHPADNETKGVGDAR